MFKTVQRLATIQKKFYNHFYLCYSSSTTPAVTLKSSFLYNGQEDNVEFKPHIGFENAIKFASPHDILKTWRICLENNQQKFISFSSYNEFLTKLSRGYFGFLSGHKILDLGFEIRIEAEKTFSSVDPKFDSLLIKSAVYSPLETLPRIVNHVRNVATNDSYPIYVSLISLLGHFGLVDSAVKIYKAFEDLDLLEFKVAIVEVYANNGQLEKAEEIFASVPENCNRTKLMEFYIPLLRASANSGNLAKTRKYFAKFSPADPDFAQSLAYSLLLNCYAQKGMIGECIEEYRNLRRKGVFGTPGIFEALIKMNLRSKDVAAATNWYFKSRGASIKPSQGMTAALMSVQYAAGEPLIAFKALVNGLKGKTYISTPIINLLMKDLKGKHIDYLRDNIHISAMPKEMVVSMVSKLMSACLAGTEQDPDTCLKLFNEFYLEDGCCYSENPPDLALISAIIANGLKGNVEESTRIFKESVDYSFAREIDYYNALLTCYAQNKLPVDALYSDFINNGLKPNAATYEALINQQKGDQILKFTDELYRAGVLVNDAKYPLVAKALGPQGLEFFRRQD